MKEIEKKIEYDYSFIDKKVEKMIKIVSAYLKDVSPDKVEQEINKAYIYAKNAHSGQFRLSWEAYINHPVEASLLLLDLNPDLFTIQACLLHDVIEDTEFKYDDIKKEFWLEVANLCAWMEKVSKVRYKWEERTISSLRKMFVAMSDDLRVIFIKLADRLHNMKTLKHHPKKDKRERIALETLNVYAPIADRLWLHSFKNRLDEECFKILNEHDYRNVKKQLFDARSTITAFKSNARIEIDKLLEWSWIKYEVAFRVKSLFSIFRKMQQKWYENINDLYDIYWIKILVWDIGDCYKVLWLVHNKWTPLPNRFKDYIALPKPNGYKSLHTTILWLLTNHRKQPTEIQIKTFEMDLTSEIWVAAHFEYKEKWSKVANDIDWVRQLKDLTESLWNNDFMDSLKIDLFKDRIFVLTPKWDSINLPAWSTPIDFAYEIHTDLWNHITIAKVNNQVHPLDKELKNWDIVEIIVDKNKKPNPFYISFVKTAKAKNCIRSFLRNEDKDGHIERGKIILNNLLEKSGFEKLDKDLTVLKILDDRQFNYEERLNLLEQLWNFSTNPNSVLKKIFKAKKIAYKPSLPLWREKAFHHQIEEQKSKQEKTIIIWWEKNIPHTIWVCCEEKLSNKIVWYINSKWVVIIHNRDCTTLKSLNKDRFLMAYYLWDELNNIIFEVSFKFSNTIWVLKDLSDILYDMNINTLEISSKMTVEHEMILNLKLEILDYDYLMIDRFLDRVKLKLWKKLLDFQVMKIQS